MNRFTQLCIDKVRTWLPQREALISHPWLKPFADRLSAPELWRLQQEPVARGVAVGIFWAFVIPVAQSVVAVVHCTWWRANIPAALAMTLITNPFTIGFWLWLAYQLGSLLIGSPADASMEPDGDTAAWIAAHGGPLLLGMGVFAVGGAAVGYWSVKLIWYFRVWFRRRFRRRFA
jgi:uncharacterized protein (DUF2062 family)